MEKISKAEAKYIYNRGGEIFLLASKMSINSQWVAPVGIKKRQSLGWGMMADKYEEVDFDSALNSFRYYNCTKETGMGLKYYKKSFWS